MYRPNGELFRHTAIPKTQRVGSLPKERFFGAISDKQLCVVDCLKYYEETTAKHRNPQSEVQPLFLSYIRPLKPVTSQCIAHWIKDILGWIPECLKPTLYVDRLPKVKESVYLTSSKWWTGAEIPPSGSFITARLLQSLYSKSPPTCGWRASGY